MEKILIFGASGLVGSYLVPILKESYSVATVGRRSTSIYSVDLEREWAWEQLPKRIEKVIYLAQSEKFREFPEAAEDVFRVNTFSLLKALDYARSAQAKTFVYASSGGVYGNSGEVFKEDAPLCPHGTLGFYLGTKMCGEILAENYAPFMNVVILRPFFVYGPGQRKDMLIPRLVERVQKEQPIQLVGENGLQITPTYVEDAARAVVGALDMNSSCKINIRGPEVLSMRQIGEHIGLALDKKTCFEQMAGEAPGKLVGSIEKMKNLLWKPRIPFSEGIRMYVNSLVAND